jgi:hypothetical protein
VEGRRRRSHVFNDTVGNDTIEEEEKEEERMKVYRGEGARLQTGLG